MKYRKNTKCIFLIGLVSFISIGYAYITSNLNIKGTTKIANAKWDVDFEYIEGGGSLGGSGGTSFNNTPRRSFHAVINNRDDYYYLIMDIKNEGDIDAELKSYEFKYRLNDGPEIDLTDETLPNYFTYSVEYLDEMQIGDRLNVGDSKRIKIEIRIRDDLSYDDFLRLYGQKITFSYKINYVQADVGA